MKNILYTKCEEKIVNNIAKNIKMKKKVDLTFSRLITTG